MWTNQCYNKVNFSLRLCIDGNILQIFNALHVSGLLKHRKINKGDVTIIGLDDSGE